MGRWLVVHVAVTVVVTACRASTTYYVLAGNTPVLVHNCPSGVGGGGGRWTTHSENAGDLSKKYTQRQSTRDPASQWYHEELSNKDS